MTNKLRIKINTKFYSVELSSDDPIRALQEMNNFLELASDEFEQYQSSDWDDEFFYIPQDVRKNDAAVAFIQEQTELSESRKYNKQVVPTKKTLDVEAQQLRIDVNPDDVRESMQKLVMGLDTAQIKSCVLHLKGRVNDESVALIKDQFAKFVDYVPLHVVQTKNNNQEVLAEAIFFGDFPNEEF